jgi:hypothetical protein
MSASAGCYAGDKSRAGLRQRNAPGRARKQWGAESVLNAAHGVTDCRRAHAELSRSSREGPSASNANDNWQMAQNVPLHSCTISHTAFDLNHLIELLPRSHLHLCRQLPHFLGAAAGQLLTMNKKGGFLCKKSSSAPARSSSDWRWPLPPLSHKTCRVQLHLILD